MDILGRIWSAARGGRNSAPELRAGQAPDANKEDEAAALRQRGNALLEQGSLAEAIACYRRACESAPEDALAWLNQGYALLQAGQADAAGDCLRRALSIDSNLADAHFLLGQSDARRGLLPQALACYDRALALDPALSAAALGRIDLLLDLQRWQEALAQIDAQGAGQAMPLRQQRARALHGLGCNAEALACIDQLLAQQPGDADALHGKANILLELGDHQGALDASAQVLAQHPGFADAMGNAGVACMRMGRLQDALAWFDRGLAQQPRDAAMHWNRGLALLTLGDLAQGWPEHEWRWGATVLRHARAPFTESHPQWAGEPLAGKTLLLHAEQGLGDSIQFVRYVPLLAAAGARIVLRVPPALHALCAGLSPACTLLAQDAPLPHLDFHCPLMSLPLAFRTTLDSIPAAGGYLRSDAAKRAHWEQALGPRRGPRVGLVWSGGTQHKNDANRSMPLEALLRAVPAHCTPVSLQKEVRPGDAGVLQASGMFHAGAALQGFDDTAALIDCVDLVVSVDTSVAHLAGALGKRLLLLLPAVPDWRWLLERQDSPWYASARLFRQGADAQWAPVLARVRAELEGAEPQREARC
ncbi:tetratricopeptide repeat protein [Caenimonas terrae]|uniref:Tetratricopeptide repeat protein n=1 Tax=Caenimonas terrae TaxID=696074 RepID=A0ABW0N872_9BURK